VEWKDRKDKAAGIRDVDFTNGTIFAAYEFDASGNAKLVTMYANPAKNP
jgi:hypothetical protein